MVITENLAETALHPGVAEDEERRAHKPVLELGRMGKKAGCLGFNTGMFAATWYGWFC